MTSSDQNAATLPGPLLFGTGTAWYKDHDSDTSVIHQPTVDAVKTAIEVGYRCLDGAQVYGTEREVGIAMKESGVPRSSFFLSTKADGVDDVEGALEASLEKLQTGYVDLYLIHSPFPASSASELQDAWAAMERCQKRGLAKLIGLSNHSVKNLKIVLEKATIRPVVNQIEIHPYLYQPELYAFVKDQGIALQGFSSLTPLKGEQTDKTRVVCKKLAEKYGVSEQAVLSRWVVEMGAAVITTSSKRERMALMLKELPSFQLTDNEVEEIAKSGTGKWVRGFYAKDFDAEEGR